MNLQRKSTVSILLIFIVVMTGTFLLSLSVGAMSINPISILVSVIRSKTDMASRVLLNIRLPRVLFTVMTGFGLSLSGAVLQSLFHNDLVDPGLIGISSGASFAVALSIVFNIDSLIIEPFFTLLKLNDLLSDDIGILIIRPLFAFGGGILAAYFIFYLSRQNGLVSVSTLILAGIAINAVFGAGTGFLTFLADNDQLRDLTFWSMGSFGGIQWKHVLIVLPVIGLSSFTLLGLSKSLNAMQLGEREALHIGVPVEAVKRRLLFSAVLCVSTMVAFTGIIGFVGLIAPHICRRIVGYDNRVLLPVSAMGGSILMLIADTISRTIIVPAELPIGIVTAVLGGPFFLFLIIGKRSVQ